ncbi:class I SAM-dependent methyltransferase [Streptomyces goshikiensis]|uniref:class I SAM-dependent methyltransferase n=1 Tax=Streptomyces goshikiensis TaxID=1942 RepID=UPI0033EC6F90
MVKHAPNSLIREIIRAAGGHDADLKDLAARYAPADIVRVLLDEITTRCPAPVNDVPVLVELAVRAGDQLFPTYLYVLKGGPVRLATKDEAFVAMRVEYELGELARELFGPVRENVTGVRRTTLFPYVTDAQSEGEESSGAEHIGTHFLAAQQGSQTVLAGCHSHKPDLSELSSRYLTPKWGSLHWFTPHYDRHFSSYRDQQVRVLEIGIGGYKHPEWGGGSLRMWKHFFHRGEIYGLDIVDKSHFDAPRITTLRGDQSDPDYLRSIAEEHGPFDIVIDDGSHINDHIRTSFQALFPHVRPGGLYVIEDLWTAYWSGFGGNEDPKQYSGTSLGLLKSLVDSIQHEELPQAGGHRPGYVDQHVVGMHLYHNLAFIEKGTNAEGGIPPWIPRDFETLVAVSSGGHE